MHPIEPGSLLQILLPPASCIAVTGLASSTDTSLVCHCQICFKSNMQSSWSNLTQLFSPKSNSESFFFLFCEEKGFDSFLCFVIATIHGNLEEGKVIIKIKYRLFLAF